MQVLMRDAALLYIDVDIFKTLFAGTSMISRDKTSLFSLN